MCHGRTALKCRQIFRCIFVCQAAHSAARYRAVAADRNGTAIAAHVAGLVPDGAVLQFGVGAVPDAILAGLTQHRDLGIHSGLITERALDLIERGASPMRRNCSTAALPLPMCCSERAAARLTRMIIRPFGSPRRAIRMGCRCCGGFKTFTAINSADRSRSDRPHSTARPRTDTTSAPLAACAISSPAPMPPSSGRAIIALPSIARGGQSRIVAKVATVSVGA